MARAAIWTEKDRATLWKMYEDGYTTSEIGQRLGRTPKAIREQLVQMRVDRAVRV